MSSRTLVRINLCVAILGVAIAHAPRAAARPSITIPECASAYNLRATIDPKKPDPKKQHQVERLLKLCQQKIDEDKAKGGAQPGANPSIIRQSVVHDARPHPQTAPPRPAGPKPAWNPQPSSPPTVQQPAQRQVSVFDLLNRLRRPKTAAPASPAPARPPAAPPRAAAVSAAAPAPAPIIPARFVPPPPPVASAEQRNLFGIQLGDSLTLPACIAGVINASNPHALDSNAKTKPRSVTTTCAQTGPSVQKVAQRMADVEGKPMPVGVQFALVRLATESCPDWLSGGCTLSVALKGGVALGVSFLTGDDATPAVIHQLRRKYAGAASSSEAAACDVEPVASDGSSRRMGSDNTWKLADLSVSYGSVNGLNCGQGRVLVQTQALSDLFDQAMSGDDQPKL